MSDMKRFEELLDAFKVAAIQFGACRGRGAMPWNSGERGLESARLALVEYVRERMTDPELADMADCKACPAMCAAVASKAGAPMTAPNIAPRMNGDEPTCSGEACPASLLDEDIHRNPVCYCRADVNREVEIGYVCVPMLRRLLRERTEELARWRSDFQALAVVEKEVREERDAAYEAGAKAVMREAHDAMEKRIGQALKAKQISRTLRVQREMNTVANWISVLQEEMFINPTTRIPLHPATEGEEKP